jgi:hypothetical protein
MNKTRRNERWFSTRNNSSSNARQESRNPQQETREAIKYCQELEFPVLQHLQDYTFGLKVKQSHYRPGQSLSVEAPRFQDNRHMKVVSLSFPRTGRLYSQEIFLVLISFRGWVNPRAVVWLEGLYQCKIPVTPMAIESATFRLVAQCINQLRHRVPRPKS